MALGTAIGAVASIGSSIIGGNASKKAAKKAADAQAQVAAENNALQREIYAKNTTNLNPFMQRGNVAGDAINALLGFPSGVGGSGGTGPSARLEYMSQPYVSTTTPGGARSAFDTFRDSDGYQFRFNEGMNALNTGYAAGGKLQSGAAAKAAIRYGQDYGSNEFGKYLGYLSGQQNVGLSGANALAGVGTGYANAVSANNQSAADAASNAALAKGSATANMFGSIAGGLGSILGSSFGGSSVKFNPSSVFNPNAITYT